MVFKCKRSRGASHTEHAGTLTLTWVKWDNKVHTLQGNAKSSSLHLWLVFLCTMIKTQYFEQKKNKIGFASDLKHYHHTKGDGYKIS